MLDPQPHSSWFSRSRVQPWVSIFSKFPGETDAAVRRQRLIATALHWSFWFSSVSLLKAVNALFSLVIFTHVIYFGVQGNGSASHSFQQTFFILMHKHPSKQKEDRRSSTWNTISLPLLPVTMAAICVENSSTFRKSMGLCAPSSTTHINERTRSFEMNLLEDNIRGLCVKCVKVTIKEKTLSIIFWQLSATFQAFLAESEFFAISLVLDEFLKRVQGLWPLSHQD